jgi:HPt (histidine-containing phosphotransfer) domain-containing protein
MRILNHEGLEESCGGDPEFASELFSDLSGRASQLRAAMGQALEAGSSDGVRKAAHELKGSSLTLGAEAVADLCKRIEILGHEKRIEEVPDLLGELDQELARLWDYLKEKGIYPAST